MKELMWSEAVIFLNPEFFWLLILVPLLPLWYFRKYKNKLAYQKLPSLEAFSSKPSFSETMQHVYPFLRSLALIFIIIALARPQTSFTKEKIKTEGIDIVIALDISSSMLAKDFKPDRLEAAKNVAIDFIRGRQDDRIGLVVFAGESFTQCPITSDNKVLVNLLKDIKCGIIEDGTAIGLGLATAVDRLRNSPGKTKVIILITDGVNNSGFIDPLMAAELAKKFNIRVYTIGVGTMGMAPYPVLTPYGTQFQNMKVEIDESLLTKIAEMTGTKYFRATNNEKFKEIYGEIDIMEKSKIELSSFKRYSDKYFPYALIATLLIFTELLFRYCFIFKMP
jgi:Ca-activated chloride channel homolog